MRPLFRPEAVDAQRQHWLGPVNRVRPVPALLLAGLAVAVLVAVALFVGLEQHTRRVAGAADTPPVAPVLQPAPRSLDDFAPPARPPQAAPPR